MAKVIMIQGTMSGVGKSLLAAGLCRIFRQDGHRVAPFKSQNMALNSYITAEGLEMGRAQVMQAEAAGIEPRVCMNPILLKPTSHTGSQVIVNGEVLGNMSAKEYFSYKKRLIPDIRRAFRRVEELADIIVIEGAGSPAEINLKQVDLVNMGMAKLVGAPVLLAGDIDRGGVFAQLLGTLLLLEEEERGRVKGLIINKFRGDKSILDPGIAMLEERGGVPVTGVIPYMEISLEDEDSLTERFDRRERGLVDIAVIRYPRISNFTDFNVFEQIPGVSVRYVTAAGALGSPDLVFLPGSKNTMSDLRWMRENGLEAAVKQLARDVPVFGICGGYQMLGRWICDPEGLEEGGQIRGMELLPTVTTLRARKERRQTEGRINEVQGILGGLSGREFRGYEIHMGQTVILEEDPVVCASPAPAGAPGCAASIPAGTADSASLASGEASGGMALRLAGAAGIAASSLLGAEDGMALRLASAAGLAAASLLGVRNSAPVILTGASGQVYGTYVHGLFDSGGLAHVVAEALAEKKGVRLCAGGETDYRHFKEIQYDKLADTMRRYLDMEKVYGMLREARMD